MPVEVYTSRVAQPARRIDDSPPIDPFAVDRAYRVHRARREARLRRSRASKLARLRFLLVLVVLAAMSVFLAFTVWRQIQELFGL